MPAFAFTARTLDGRSLKGVRVSASEGTLAADLAQDNLFLVKAVPSTGLPKGIRAATIKRKELAAFLVHLGSYLEAGVPLLAALEDYRIPEKPAFDAAIQDIRRRIEGGAGLCEALEFHPSLFSPLHISMIRAGESSGHLDEALQEVVKLVEWEEAFSGQVKQASTYPMIVLGLVGLIVIIVSVFALPPILKLLKDFNVPLPLPTRIFIAFGEFLVAWGWLAVLLPVGLLIGFRIALRDPEVRLWWDTQVLGFPLIGPMVTKLGLSRFATFFAAQYRAGIPIIQILRDCEGVTANARLGLSVRRIREGIEGGERLAVMAASVGTFPPLVVRMLAIGEEAGNLEKTLGKVSAYFDAEVQAGIKKFFQLLEPLLLVLLAGIIVFVAVSILLPIYTLIGGINASVQ